MNIIKILIEMYGNKWNKQLAGCPSIVDNNKCNGDCKKCWNDNVNKVNINELKIYNFGGQ